MDQGEAGINKKKRLGGKKEKGLREKKSTKMGGARRKSKRKVIYLNREYLEYLEYSEKKMVRCLLCKIPILSSSLQYFATFVLCAACQMH